MKEKREVTRDKEGNVIKGNKEISTLVSGYKRRRRGDEGGVGGKNLVALVFFSYLIVLLCVVCYFRIHFPFCASYYADIHCWCNS